MEERDAPEVVVARPRLRHRRGIAPRTTREAAWATDAGAQDFPRSRLMRILADPRQRRLLILGITVLAMLLSRRQRLLRGGLVMGTLREFLQLLRARYH